MTPLRGLLGATVVLALLVGGFATPTGLGGPIDVASAGHDPSAANYTVTPLETRKPGAEDVEYGQTVHATSGTDLETLTRTVAIYEAGDWSDCGPTSASVFGIDRGETHDGYEIDEELTNNVKSFSAGEDRLETEYNREDDFGASTYFDDGDEFVSVTECIDNPDTPGWYRITGRTTGITPEGETVTFGGQSHYFWICNCPDEAAARQQLGPPPNEPDTTPTPTGTASTRTSEATGTATSGDTDLVDTPTAGAPGTGPTATVTAGDDGVTTADARTPAPTATRPTTDTASWDEIVYRTPTRSDGAGPGPIVALASLLAGALLARRRA